LKRAGEPVPQVERQQKHTDYVQPYIPGARKGQRHYRIEILDFLSIVGHAGDTTPVHGGPKIPHVNYNEDKDESSQYPHVARSPVGRISDHLVSDLTARRTISRGEKRRPDYVNQDKGVQHIRDGDDQRIRRHELRIHVERASAVRLEELQVTNKMYNQKGDQKESGQGHDQLLSIYTGKKTCKPIHIILLRKFRRCQK